MLRLILAAVAALFVTCAFGQGYPNRAVRVIIPFPPGGTLDALGRALAQKLGEQMGQSFVVDNRPGGNGIIGADAVAKARPDGYTLLIVNVGMVSINPALYPKLPYDADHAFVPISLFCELPFVLMGSPKFAPHSVQELVAYAKANPDKVTFASSGLGGSPHLTAEIFQLATGTRMTHVPYKGGGPAMTDLMAGHVDLLFASVLEGSATSRRASSRASRSRTRNATRRCRTYRPWRKPACRTRSRAPGSRCWRRREPRFPSSRK